MAAIARVPIPVACALFYVAEGATPGIFQSMIKPIDGGAAKISVDAFRSDRASHKSMPSASGIREPIAGGFGAARQLAAAIWVRLALRLRRELVSMPISISRPRMGAREPVRYSAFFDRFPSNIP